MSAVLKVEPITAKVIHRPTYHNGAHDSLLADFGNWYRVNEPALSQYWRELGGDETTSSDFFDFCAAQYDVEVVNAAAAVRKVYGSEQYGDPRSYEQWAEDQMGYHGDRR